MKRAVIPGRYSAAPSEDLVVFLIGMRINRPLALPKWTWTARQMRPMLEAASRDPELGLHHFELGWLAGGPFVLTYWRSLDHLERFANDDDLPHAGPWREYFRRVGNDGHVGIWHETYLVHPDELEAVYANMPVFGLAAATNHEPALGRRATAARRLGRATGAEPAGHAPGAPEPVSVTDATAPRPPDTPRR